MHPPDLPPSPSLGEQTGTAPNLPQDARPRGGGPRGCPGAGGPLLGRRLVPGGPWGCPGARGPYWGGGWCPGALGRGGGESASEEQSEETCAPVPLL